MSEYPRTPMRSYEKLAVQYLLGLVQEAESALQTLKPRLEITNVHDKLQQSASDITDVVSEVLMTVPEKQLIALKRNLANLQMHIRIKRASAELEPTGASYVDTALLTAVLKEYAHEKCKMCLGGAEEQQQCKYKELLDEVVMDYIPELPYGCKYRDADWEDER